VVTPVREALPLPAARATALRVPGLALPALTALAFLVLFWSPITTLLQDWWSDPDAGHGLLLAPIAVWLAWKRGLREDRASNFAWGLALLVGAVLLRYVSGLAAELFTMRVSLLMAAAGLVVFSWGWRQLLHWWMPVLLLGLSIPIPDVIMSTIALPLQLSASKWGAAMLEWRHVPVVLEGNVIQLPGRSLFVTEACSGLRSLTALIALGVLTGGLFLKTPLSRVLLVAIAIPVAMALNALRIFLTGFLVFFVGPEWGQGVMHYSEGWGIFVVAMVILGFVAFVLGRAEGWLLRFRRAA